MAASPCRPSSPQVLEADDGVMLVGKGDKFQLWNPKRWQARRDADRDKMAAFVRGLVGRRRMSGHDGTFPCSLNEVVDALQPRDGGRYVDGTFGAGGYTTRDARSRRLRGDRASTAIPMPLPPARRWPSAMRRACA